MTKTLFKNTIREILNSKARFLSILAIIALGVGFFAGIKSTAPSMNNMAQNYYSDTNLMDFRLMSTVGIDDEDIKEIKSLESVTDVMPSYSADVITVFGNTSSVVHLMSLPEKYKDNNLMNDVNLIDGRMPEKSGEILVEKGNYSGKKLAIGDKVKVDKKAGDTNTEDILNTLEYTVVGIVQSPLYISHERGSTTIGNGKIALYMYVLPEAFKVEKYTELYVKTIYSNDGISPFSDEYENGINEVKEEIEQITDHLSNVFNTDVIGKAEKEINDGWKDYNKEKDSANKKLESSRQELEDAQKTYDEEISSAQNQLNDAQSQITQGEEEFSKSLDEFNKQISDGQSEINSSEKQLNDAKLAYDIARKEFDENISLAQEKIDAGFEQYKTAYDTYYDLVKPYMIYELSTLQLSLEQVNAQITGLEKQLEQLSPASPDEIAKIEEIKAQLAILYYQQSSLQDGIDQLNYTMYVAEQELDNTKMQIEISQNQLETEKASGEVQLQQALLKIQQGDSQLQSGKAELENAQALGSVKLKEAQDELSGAIEELQKAKLEFEEQKTSGKNKIDDGWAQYNDAMATAQEKLTEAERKLQDAQSELDKVSDAKWYIFTRDNNPGYSDFLQNTNRVDAVASVFPTFFLLVAVLVCLTTMTRLIEEKRTEIGTLKALGYSNKSIIGKFMMYSSLAGVIGSVIGIVAGECTLPFIIYNAYRSLYSMADLVLIIDWTSVIAGFIAAMLCTVTVSLVICMKNLKHSPASLMRPKAPKAGKRILLERITVFWKHLGFTSKVTARNLFRYKARLLMTIVGVAGCTALIVAAFGLLDSISALTEKQYGEIDKYSAIIALEKQGSEQENQSLITAISEDTRITDYSLIKQTLVTVKNDKAVKDKNTSIVVPQNLDSFKNLLSLHTRIGHNPLELNDDSVIITEKMATELGVKAGDKVAVVLDDKEVNVTVDSICENYIYNYVYMTPEMFSKTFGEEVQYNCMYIKDTDSSLENEIAHTYIDRDDVVSVSFMTAALKDFNKMLNSLNMVVLVLIICAGTLAFVVLYNLTNINMEERVREIATIKVLGFYNKETAAYIYRENIVLTILGTVVGLLLGIMLTGFIVTTVEVDNIMFGKDIYFTTYLYATGLTFFFSLVVNIFMYFKMKKIDMVESLKSIE